MNAMDRCPYTKSGKHSLMAIIPENHEHPLTLACTWCGMTAQYPVTWAQGGTKDDLPADAITRLVERQ